MDVLIKYKIAFSRLEKVLWSVFPEHNHENRKDIFLLHLFYCEFFSQILSKSVLCVYKLRHKCMLHKYTHCTNYQNESRHNSPYLVVFSSVYMSVVDQLIASAAHFFILCLCLIYYSTCVSYLSSSGRVHSILTDCHAVSWFHPSSGAFSSSLMFIVKSFCF